MNNFNQFKNLLNNQNASEEQLMGELLSSIKELFGKVDSPLKYVLVTFVLQLFLVLAYLISIPILIFSFIKTTLLFLLGTLCCSFHWISMVAIAYGIFLLL